MKPTLAIAAAVGLALVVVSACSSGGGGATSSTAPPPTTITLGPDSPQIKQAVAEYKTYAQGQVTEIVTLTRKLTDAVRAGDLAAAQAAYAPSRVPWERIEPIAGLVEEIDGKVDARVDDFAGVDDPAFTGWHRLEYLLFAQNTTAGGKPFADQLDADLAVLQQQFGPLEIPTTDVAIGSSELIEEVSKGKITGEEDRYSKTDLWDFHANLEGSQAVIDKLSPALQQANPTLLADIKAGFAALTASLAPLRSGDGWQLYCLANDEYPSPRCPAVTVPPALVDTLKAQLAGLSEKTSLVAGALGLK